MPAKTYGIIQWVTRRVGSIALRHFVDNPVFDLVGVFVTNPGKVGKDAGDIVDVDHTEVMATSSADDILALDADCVFLNPMYAEVDVICQLLCSGKNVVTTGGYFHPTPDFETDCAKIEKHARGAASASTPEGFTLDLTVTFFRSRCAAS